MKPVPPASGTVTPRAFYCVACNAYYCLRTDYPFWICPACEGRFVPADWAVATEKSAATPPGGCPERGAPIKGSPGQGG